MTVKKKDNSYYLYKRTSKRVKGKKFPQPVDHYVGVITPDGIVYAKNRIVPKHPRIKVREYGYTKALMEKCPDSWKHLAGGQWEDILKIIVVRHSPNTYLLDDKNLRKESDIGCNYSALYQSLGKAMKHRYGIDNADLEPLKYIYALRDIDKEETFISVPDDAQSALLEKLSLNLEVQ